MAATNPVTGNQIVELGGGGASGVSIESISANADDASNTRGQLAADARISGYDGSTWDRIRVVAPGADPGAVPVLAVLPVLGTGSSHVRQFNAAINTDANAGSGFPSAAQMVWNGATWDRERTPNVFKVVALTAATAETTIWTPAVGKKFRLMGFILTCGAASTLTFKDNTAGSTIFAARGATDTPISPDGMRNGILSAVANNVLTVTRGTSATLDGVVFGCEE